MDNQPSTVIPSPQPPEPTPISPPPKIKHAHKFIFGYLALIVLVAAVSGVYTWQHKKVNSLNAQVSSLQKQVASLEKTKTSTATSSSNLPTGSVDTTIATLSYAYPAGYFILSYPRSWTLSPFSAAPAVVQPGILADGLTISPPNASQGETTGISVYKSTSLINALNEAFVGNGTTVENNQSLRIGGYSAMYQQNVIPNSSTEDSYAITNGTYTVVLSFTVNQTFSQPMSTFDATSLLPEFNEIVTSLKF